MTKVKYFLQLIIVFIFAISVQAQENVVKMKVWQDSLASLGKQVFNENGEPERLEKNFTLVKTLVSALKEKHSFNYQFSKLDMISVLKSPDQKFRIFSWNVPLNDGSYLYYGAIQFKTNDGSLKLKPLLDKTFEIKDANKEIVTNSNWYGAQYYDIIPQGNHYILLGWKGHNRLFTQKVIESLSINKEEISFGKSVFLDEKAIVRKIFNYSKQASMLLKFDVKSKKIIFDHLIPQDPSMKGQFQFYGPDLSYDAYELESTNLKFLENIQYLNEENDSEENFLDPKRKKIKEKSGFSQQTK